MDIKDFVNLYGYRSVSLTLRDLMTKAKVAGNDSRIIEVMAQHLEQALKSVAESNKE